jgi:hypothetical protein
MLGTRALARALAFPRDDRDRPAPQALLIVLAITGTVFVAEVIGGLLSGSAGAARRRPAHTDRLHWTVAGRARRVARDPGRNRAAPSACSGPRSWPRSPTRSESLCPRAAQDQHGRSGVLATRTSICTIRTRSRVPTACAATASALSAAWLASPRAVSTSMSRPTMHWPSAHRPCKAVGPRCRCWSPPSDGSRTWSCDRGWEGLDRGPGADPKPSWS